MTSHAVGWRTAAVALFLVAAVLGWMAFTRFGAHDPPPSGSPGFEEYERDQMRVAQQSILLGLAAAFALAGGFACWQRSGRPIADPPAPPRPPGP